MQTTAFISRFNKEVLHASALCYMYMYILSHRE